MALTPAEKQRRYRERQKKRLENAPDVTLEFMKRPFSDFLIDRSGNTDFEGNFDYIGLDIRGSLYDEEQAFETEGDWEEPFSGNSLDRMTGLAGIMMDTVREFYALINTYKLEEIDARIAEIEQADLSDPATRKKALADVVRLNQIRARLDKEFRRSFREVNVKGTPSD